GQPLLIRGKIDSGDHDFFRIRMQACTNGKAWLYDRNAGLEMGWSWDDGSGLKLASSDASEGVPSMPFHYTVSDDGDPRLVVGGGSNHAQGAYEVLLLAAPYDCD